jgi:WLM domain
MALAGTLVSRLYPLFRLEHEAEIVAILETEPSPRQQRALLCFMLRQLGPVLARHALHMPFACEPGLRLTRRYGLCHFDVNGQPLIQVRCTSDGDRRRWRRPSAIVGTLIHELAHLRYRGHSPAFWRLCRAMLNEAAALGVYSGDLDDPTEQPQGRGRLAGSAADDVLSAARARRREHARAARELVGAWPVGAWARLRSGSAAASSALVQVVQQRRTRLMVQTRAGRRYLVPAGLLEPLTSQM